MRSWFWLMISTTRVWGRVASQAMVESSVAGLRAIDSQCVSLPLWIWAIRESRAGWAGPRSTVPSTGSGICSRLLRAVSLTPASGSLASTSSTVASSRGSSGRAPRAAIRRTSRGASRRAYFSAWGDRRRRTFSRLEAGSDNGLPFTASHGGRHGQRQASRAGPPEGRIAWIPGWIGREETRLDAGGPAGWRRPKVGEGGGRDQGRSWRFFSNRIRSPSRVRKGATWSMVVHSAAIRRARPPVATTRASAPSSVLMRAFIESTRPA